MGHPSIIFCLILTARCWPPALPFPPFQKREAGAPAFLLFGEIFHRIRVRSDESSGDLSSGTGTYEIMGADGSHIDHGKWMNFSKKSGGTWKIQCDIFKSDMPMPAGGGK
jgi:hypothetical protein